jgi:hypothetical protein
MPGLSIVEKSQPQFGGVKKVKGCLIYASRVRQKPAKRSGKATVGPVRMSDAFQDSPMRRAGTDHYSTFEHIFRQLE